MLDTYFHGWPAYFHGYFNAFSTRTFTDIPPFACQKLKITPISPPKARTFTDIFAFLACE